MCSKERAFCGGGVSRAAKGADCKSAGLRLRRFESYLPHQFEISRKLANRRRSEKGLPCCIMLQNISLYFQGLSSTPGDSMQHERNMDDQRAMMVTSTATCSH